MSMGRGECPTPHNLFDYFINVYLLFYAVLVEKILRIQPNVKKLFLLVRALDTKLAKQRFNDEVKHTFPASI